MRVLVVTNMYPPHHYGGYELSCRDVVERWRARGHEVTVLTSTVRVRGVEEPDDPGVHRRLRMYWDDHVLLSPPRLRRLAVERANQRVLRDLLAATRPDVVSVWQMGGMSLQLLTTLVGTGVPLVYVVCDDWLVYGPRLDAWSRMFDRRPVLARVVARLAGVPTRLPDLGASGTFCFVSATTRDRAQRAGRWRFPDSTVVHSGIDRDDFPAAGPRRRRWGWRLLYAGRIDPRKGIDTAVRALPLLPDEATLQVLGRGDDAHLRELRALADTLGVAGRVRFGVVDRAALAAAYRAADVVVFPSTWDEPFGLVPVEAMACGTPVVATGRGGSGEYLQDRRNALLFPAGDAATLAAVVRELAGDPALRRRLVGHGRTTADRFTVDAYADTLEGVHRAAVSRGPARR